MTDKELNSSYISSIENTWSIIETYFKDKHLENLVRHQIESYNDFVEFQLFKTIKMFNPVRIVSENDFDPKSQKYSLEILINFENFNIYRPQIHENNGSLKIMFPQEARMRNFTYASSMTLDIVIKYIVRTGENLNNCETFHKTMNKINIGKLPIMLKSNICILSQYKHIDPSTLGECNYDAGGYFIINGSEKTVLGQERIADNKIYCHYVAKNNKYSWIAEIKSVPDYKCLSPKQINIMISCKDNGFGFPITIQIPRIKQPVPLFILFRALGIISDKKICEYILLDLKNEKYTKLLDALQASIIDANNYITQEDCIKYISTYAMYTPINMDKETGIKKKYSFTQDILGTDLYPHCTGQKQKIYFLGYMTNKLLQANFNWIDADDRDSYLNKRVDLTGALLNNLFRNYFNKLVKDMEKQVQREINTGSWKSTDDYINIINKSNINKIIKSATLENGIKRSLSTGDFGTKGLGVKVGVAQVLTRQTYVASLSHMRRICTPMDKSGKLVPPRKLHNTSWGYLCPSETPEGASVGIVKNLSLMTHITIHSNSSPIYDCVSSNINKIEDIVDISTLDNAVKVLINGSWVGTTTEPFELYNDLKDKKTNGILNIYTSVIFDIKMKEIRISNDSGRLTRPLFRVKDNTLLVTNEIMECIKNDNLGWNDLLINHKIPNAIIEYIDPEEQSYSMLAMKPNDLYTNITQNYGLYKYTHCEIHASTIFGVASSLIPFPDNNQSPRNTYQAAQSKQAIGIPASSYHNRYDKTSYFNSCRKTACRNESYEYVKNQ